jgi:restriction system protein
MSIPKYEEFMLPVLKIIADGKEHKMKEIVVIIADDFKISEEDREKELPSGGSVFYHRVHWAITYMHKAGLLSFISRGNYKITDRGHKLIESDPKEINCKYLEIYPEFNEFKKRSRQKATQPQEKENEAVETPEETLEAAYQKIKQVLASDLLAKIKECSPKFFERLVVDLLLKMGYGGPQDDAGEAIGRTGDGGIDGIIKEDKLGLDIIYIQAKRWENTVPVKEIRDFAGALLHKKAKKGIFITTSDFASSAYSFVKEIEPKIVLIDSQKLTDFMIEYNVGVSSDNNKTYKIKKIDSDYFED